MKSTYHLYCTVCTCDPSVVCLPAARLYITVGKCEEAVSMYKQLKMYGDMVRLVKQYFAEHLDATHLQLAKVSDLLSHLVEFLYCFAFWSCFKWRTFIFRLRSVK